MTLKKLVLCLNVVLYLVHYGSTLCNKTPEGIIKPRNKNDAGRYLLEISGNPRNYSPSQRYNISLKINPRAIPLKAFRSFMITLEPDDGDSSDESAGQLGLDHGTDMLTRFSSQCPNTVVESSVVPKSEIQVYWIAPPKGSGCVSIKATVVESRDNWFSEDGPLTRRLCEETMPDENIQPNILRRCCACDEAKYEVAFEGKWTRNTHPRHFPKDQWNTRFSDVIGASHHLYHAFWKYEELASEGLKELAETGSTKTLELELKNNSAYIRTIIKARGLLYPNITKSTFAVFRVDNKNHLVSLVSRITPSPDWIVGVSNLELCKEDCTWEEGRTLNLYPWDVGTNDGVGYTSSVPSFSPQPIRRITPNNPNDPDSPFYSEEGEEIKPIARLHLTRQRLYSKQCQENEEEEVECATSEWSEWSPCTVTCGNGTMYRQRRFMDEGLAGECKVNLIDFDNCFAGDCPESGEEEEERDEEQGEEEEKENHDSEICGDDGEKCEEDSKCPGTFWGPWSDCSVGSSSDCGRGTKTRMRMNKQNHENEESECSDTSQTEDCEVPCDEEGSTSGSSKSMFPGSIPSKSQIVSQHAVGEVIDCKVSKWSRWSKCHLTDSDPTCGEGYKIRFRKILRHASNGGMECPEKLSQRKKCHVRCPELEDLRECVMGKWSNWTPCSANCGGAAVRLRTRPVLYQPQGVTCPVRVQKKACHLPLACSEDGKPIMN